MSQEILCGMLVHVKVNEEGRKLQIKYRFFFWLKEVLFREYQRNNLLCLMHSMFFIVYSIQILLELKCH
jgi:hypothetical protein